MNGSQQVSVINRNFNRTAAEARKARVRVRIKRRLRKAGIDVKWNASIGELRALLELVP